MAASKKENHFFTLSDMCVFLALTFMHFKEVFVSRISAATNTGSLFEIKWSIYYYYKLWQRV